MEIEANESKPDNQLTLNFTTNPDRSEKPKKGNFMNGFFGEGAQNYHILSEEKEENQGSESGDEEEGFSPISPIKGKKHLCEEDRLEKLQDLDMKQLLLFAKIKSVSEKINNMEADSEKKGGKDLLRKPTKKDLSNLQKELEDLHNNSETITIMKEQLETQAFISVGKNIKTNSEAPLPDKENQQVNYTQKIRDHRWTLSIHKMQLKILEHYKKKAKLQIKGLEKEAESNSAKTLDCDTYFFSSMVFEYLIFFLGYGLILMLLLSIFMIFQFLVLILNLFALIFRLRTTEEAKEALLKAKERLLLFMSVSLQMVFILAFFMVLFFPGILVVTTQFFCIINLQDVVYEGRSQGGDSLLILKEFMILFFFFLSMKEVSSAINAISFHYKRTFKPEAWCILFPIRISPQILQIVMTFWFCYINIYLIVQVDEVADLIQNFAALAIVLEFDNYIMDFLRYMRFHIFYKQFLQLFGAEPHKKHEISKAVNEEKITELEGTIKEYEKILKDLRAERRKGRSNAEKLQTINPEEMLKTTKEKIEKIKKSNPSILRSQMQEKNSQNPELDEFSKIMSSIVDKNIILTAISFLGRQEAIKTMLTSDKYPISKEFELTKTEKTFFNWFAFFTVAVGILVITLVFVIVDSE